MLALVRAKAGLFKDRVEVQEVIDELLEEGEGNAGCVVLFAGFVRAVAEDQASVIKLSYEVYEEVVEKEMLRLAEEVALKHGVLSVRLYHKVGDALVKQPAIYAFVSAKHRKEAFNALVELVDRAKRELPIWKKEFTNRGERWVRG